MLADAPLFELAWTYDELRLQFYVRRVTRWEGEPLPLENQRLQWVSPARIDRAALAPADCRMLQLLLDQALASGPAINLPPRRRVHARASQHGSANPIHG